MARPAVDRPVLPDKHKPGAVVAEGHLPGVDLPTGCGVAIGTVNLQAFTVRGLAKKSSHPETEAKNY